jgi:hypothetical protein
VFRSERDAPFTTAGLREWWNALVRLPSLASRPIPTCYGMLAASLWPTKDTVCTPLRPILVTRISKRRYSGVVSGPIQGFLAVKMHVVVSTKRLIYLAIFIGAIVLLSILSAFGAAQLVFGLGLESEAAALAAAIAAFMGNFFTIYVLSENIIRSLAASIFSHQQLAPEVLERSGALHPSARI